MSGLRLSLVSESSFVQINRIRTKERTILHDEIEIMI